MILHCYAIVSKAEERVKLMHLLKHHKVQFVETHNHISVDVHCVSYRTVEALISCFESVMSEERGFSVIGNKEEVG